MVIFMANSLKPKEESGLRTSFNNANVFKDSPAIFVEIDTTWEGVHESPLMHHAGETCRARGFLSLTVPRVKRETHGYLAALEIWSSTSFAYKIKEGSHFNYSMVCNRKQ